MSLSARTILPTRTATLLALCAATLLLLCFAAVPALAGTYDLNSCHLPNATVASIDGWSASSSGSYVSAQSDCSGSGGAMAGSLYNGVNHGGGDNANWRFTAPADTKIVQLQVNRHVDAGTSQAYGTPQYQLTADGNAVLENCNQFSTGCSTLDGTVDFDVNSATTVDFNAACSGMNGCPARSGPTVGFTINRARVRLRDDTGPSVSGVSGDLATADTVSATSTVSFTASDKGGGVYRTRVYVDGQIAGDQVVDDNSGLCVEPFTHAVPCKLQTAATAQLDTTKYDDGRVLDVKVDVTDAAGNTATVLSDHRVTVDNTPPCLRPAAKAAGLFLYGTACNPQLRKNSQDANGQGATLAAALTASFTRTVKARCPTAAKRKAKKHCHRTAPASSTKADAGAKPLLIGRLTNTAGTPIVGATIWLAKTIEGASPRMFASLTTTPTGRFRTRLPAHQPNGILKAYYFPSTADNQNIASRDLRLRVRAGVYLTAKRTSNRTVAFKGHVLSQTAGNGLVIALQVREAGAWRTFRQTRGRGVPSKFTASYRFVGRPTASRFRFRAVVIRQTGFPYDSGGSRSVPVRMR